MSEVANDIQNDTEYMEISLDDLETLVGSGVQENINIAEMLETEMVTSRVLYLNGEVEADTVDWMIQMIHYWNRTSDEKDGMIYLHIDTPGGDAYKCGKLCSAILNSKIPVVGVVEGSMCMSAGFYILSACKHRIVSKLSNLMYHQLSAASEPKSLHEMKVTSDHYTSMQNALDEMLVERTKIPMEKLKEVRNSNIDWYLSSSELELIADEIID